MIIDAWVLIRVALIKQHFQYKIKPSWGLLTVYRAIEGYQEVQHAMDNMSASMM